MIKTFSCLKILIGCFLVQLQVSDSWCEDISPSVVKIYSDGKYICAGTLVKDNYVVTSSECLIWHNTSVLSVVGNDIGDADSTTNESPVSGVIEPENYNRYTGEPNLAVLKLAKSIVGPNVKSAELCNLKSFQSGEPLTVYAWDLYDRENLTHPGILGSYNINVIDKDTCARLCLQELSNSTFCGAARGRIECFVDRGGPAVIRGQFCGVYVMGPVCIEHCYPGMFTSLADPNVLQFIKESLSK